MPSDEGGDGILILSLKELFAKVKEQTQLCSRDLSQTKVYIIRCSYFEIYNDAVYDLLNTHKEQAFNEPLQLNEDIRVSIYYNYQLIFRRKNSLSEDWRNTLWTTMRIAWSFWDLESFIDIMQRPEWITRALEVTHYSGCMLNLLPHQLALMELQVLTWSESQYS